MIDFTNVTSASPSIDANVILDVPAGAYIVRIVKAELVEDKMYYKLTLDVAEGEFANFAENAEAATGNDWSYKLLFAGFSTDKMLAQFSRLLDCLEESNRSFKADLWKRKQDAKSLEGLLFGVVMDESEYNGKIRVRPNYFKCYNIQDVDDGKCAKAKILDKPKAQPVTAATESVNDDNLPF